jgi:hypothetical protein
LLGNEIFHTKNEQHFMSSFDNSIRNALTGMQRNRRMVVRENCVPTHTEFIWRVSSNDFLGTY